MARKDEITAEQAIRLAKEAGWDFEKGFHVQGNSFQKGELVRIGERKGYRKPRNGGGSYGRYFFKYLQNKWEKSGGKSGPLGGLKKGRKFMIKPKHLLLAGVIGAGIFFGVKAARAAKNLVILPKAAGLPRFQGLTNLVIPLGVTIQNPTNGKLKFIFPHIQVLLDGTPVGATASLPDILTLAANGEVDLRAWLQDTKGEAFDLVINLTTAIFVAPVLMQIAQGKSENVQLTAKITTTVFPPGVPVLDGKLISVEYPIPIGKQTASV